jgi:hypothetical protein
MEIPSMFPHLKKIRFKIKEKVTRNGLWRFLETMADRLVHLRIYALNPQYGGWAQVVGLLVGC